MITKFDSLFAGHVDMDNVGYGGIPVNDRIFPNEHLATVFDKAQAMAQLMDRLGYDTFWMAEHHFQREGYECIPNVLMTALHLAHLTRRLRLGCGFNITPMWHPLRLAEDYATADILSGGRITFGVGRGYHTREVETFGSPLLDQTANRELFEEQINIIFKAFNNKSFSHKGKHYTLPPQVSYRGYTLQGLTLVPRPLRLPVECWQQIQGGSERALGFTAKHGIQGLIGGGSAEGGAMHKTVLAWQEAHARIGKHLELGERLCFGFHFFIADSREAGVLEAGKYYEENMKMFGRCSSRLLKKVVAGFARCGPLGWGMGVAMRGDDEICGKLFSYIDLEDRVRADHPLRVIREIANAGAGGAVGRVRGALFRDGAAVGAAGEIAAGDAAAGLLLGALGAATDGADRVRPVVPLVCRHRHRRSGVGPFELLEEPRPAAGRRDRRQVPGARCCRSRGSSGCCRASISRSTAR